VAAAGIYAVRWLWQITNATALFPSLLWIVRRTMNGRRVPVALMTLVALAFALSGFPAAIAYGTWLVVVVAVVGLLRRIRNGRGRPSPHRLSSTHQSAPVGIARASVAVVIAALIAIPALIPFAQLLRRSGYLEVRKETSLQATYPKEHWLNFVRPDRLGNPVDKDWRGDPRLGPLNNYIETSIYLGLLTLPLALAGLFNRRARGRWLWMLIAAFILACMFGAPGLSAFVSRIPGFKYSALARVALLLPLPAGYLAAAGSRFFRRFGVVHFLAALLAFDLALFAGRFYPYLEPRLADVPSTPATRYLASQPKPFRIAPFFNYLWPNTSEIMRLEDVRSHFGSEAMYRRLMLRLDPTAWSGTSTILSFNSLQFHFEDRVSALLGIRYFIEHREIDVIKWGIFKETEPGVVEHGTIGLGPRTQLERSIRIDAEPFWSIELPVNITEGRGRLHVSLLKEGRVVWNRTFSKEDANFMNKLYVPLRPYARLGETVILRVRSEGLRGSVLEGGGGLFYGRVKTPLMFDRAFSDGKLFLNLAELPRFRAVSRLRKLNDEEFLAARDVDFESEAVITDDPVQLPALAPATARVQLAAYAPDEQRVITDSNATFFLASSEKLTPELAATIDGRPAALIRTDLLFAGLTVPAGHHEIVYTRRIARGWWWTAWVGLALWVLSLVPWRRVNSVLSVSLW
jgi:hypothetical protein